MTSRVFACEKDPESETYYDRDFPNFFGLSGCGFMALVVIPMCTKIPFEKTSIWALRASIPRIPLSIVICNSLFSTMIDHKRKGKALHSNYSVHHQVILQLPLKTQEKIFTQLIKFQLPKQILDHPPAIFKTCKFFPSIFKKKPDPAAVESRNKLIKYLNPLLSQLYLPTFQPLGREVENQIKENLKHLSLHQIQWFILNLCLNPDYELSTDNFRLLKEKAQQITETDSTGLVDKLKIADSPEHLKKLINSPA